MNAHKTLVKALAGSAPPDDPHEIVCGSLEFAASEADALHAVLSPDAESVLAAAIEGRLRALYRFIGDHCEIHWRPGHEPKIEGES